MTAAIQYTLTMSIYFSQVSSVKCLKMYKCSKHNDSKMKENQAETVYNWLYRDFGKRFLHLNNYPHENLSILCIFFFSGLPGHGKSRLKLC